MALNVESGGHLGVLGFVLLLPYKRKNEFQILISPDIFIFVDPPECFVCFQEPLVTYMTLFHNRRYMWPKAVLNCISKWRECRKTTRKYYYYTSCKLNKTGQSSLRRRPSLFIPTLRSLLSTLNFRWLASCLKGNSGLNIVIVSGSAIENSSGENK